ncbi:MAG: dephospho-CoA kinase [Kangiellaceae bacterium]|nr:dephospho-CoA kinase [Kangiellaceae bacterium]
MNKNKLVIGLTGGIASGKSQVSGYFAELGIDVYDSDKIARDLFRPKSTHLFTLLQHFGDGIFESNGTLNRKALGKIVFSDVEKLDWLNNFTHPLINEEMKRQVESSTSPYVILDIPLLVNKQGKISGYLKRMVDRVLVVSTSVELQIKRVLERDKLSVDQAVKIIESQSTLEQKVALADDIINNLGTLQQLSSQVDDLHSKYLNIAR